MTKWRPRAEPCPQRQEKLDIIHISTSQSSWPNEDGERRLLPLKTRKVGHHPYIYLPVFISAECHLWEVGSGRVFINGSLGWSTHGSDVFVLQRFLGILLKKNGRHCLV
jgi:hypothetical protein